MLAMVLSTPLGSNMILLIGSDLCFYDQTNEYNLKIILVVKFSSWFLYIWIEQILWAILMVILLVVLKSNLLAVFLVLSLWNLEGDF